MYSRNFFLEDALLYLEEGFDNNTKRLLARNGMALMALLRSLSLAERASRRRGVHIRTGGIGEIGLEVLEFAGDGEFVVAEEEVDVGHGYFLGAKQCFAPTGLFRDNTMQSLADEEDFCDLHITQVCFGGDVGLQPGTQRFAEQISKRSKD